MILLNSLCDSGENEVLSVKIGARVLDVWLDMFFWAQLAQNLVFRPQTPNV